MRRHLTLAFAVVNSILLLNAGIYGLLSFELLQCLVGLYAIAFSVLLFLKELACHTPACVEKLTPQLCSANWWQMKGLHVGILFAAGSLTLGLGWLGVTAALGCDLRGLMLLRLQTHARGDHPYDTMPHVVDAMTECRERDEEGRP